MLYSDKCTLLKAIIRRSRTWRSSPTTVSVVWGESSSGSTRPAATWVSLTAIHSDRSTLDWQYSVSYQAQRFGKSKTQLPLIYHDIKHVYLDK